MLGAHARARTRPHLVARALTLAACAALLAAIAAPTTGAASPKSVGHASKAKITKVGEVNLARASGGSAEIGANPETGPREPDPDLDAKVSGSQANSRVPADHIPTPASKSVVGAGAATGFDGIDHVDQRLAGTGVYTNTNFSTEPPDMALCVSANYVLQGGNSAIAVYSKSGTALTAPIALNEFFHAAPAVKRTAPITYGDDIGDVKCYYDPEVDRFFVSSFRLPLDPATGAYPEDQSHVMLAVSTSGDPAGSWLIYDLDTTDGDGSLASHPHCPCLADQPLIGADHYGFYVTTNEYSLAPFGAYFNGAQVYAMSKAQLASGTATSAVQLSGIPLAESTAYTIQPATTPAGGTYDTARGGTEYFLSALDFTATLDNRIAVWALTGTSTLGTTNAVSLHSAVLDSQVYGQPPDAEQKAGATPLLQLEAAGLEGVKSVEHLELLAGNDDRMNEVKYAAGALWGNVNTAVKTENGNVQVGTAYWVVEPGWAGNVLGGSILNQGYVSVNRANVLFGAIAANNDGDATMGFTLVGRDYYPSIAYVTLSKTQAASNVHLMAAGKGPEDGFTGYRVEFGNGTARWGDYSAATADEDGTLWMANEYIPRSCPTPADIDNVCRTIFANWGTFVTKVNP